jgi:hypothetical protein
MSAMRGVAHLDRTGCTVVSDVDTPRAPFELHESIGRASLQIATAGSSWLLVAARPWCVLETVESTVTLQAGDICALPAGRAGLLHGAARGQWLALRCVGRQLHFDHRERLSLVRVMLDLAESLRTPDTGFALAQRMRLAAWVQRDLERSQREVRAVEPDTVEPLPILSSRGRSRGACLA